MSNRFKLAATLRAVEVHLERDENRPLDVALTGNVEKPGRLSRTGKANVWGWRTCWRIELFTCFHAHSLSTVTAGVRMLSQNNSYLNSVVLAIVLPTAGNGEHDWAFPEPLFTVCLQVRPRPRPA